METELNTTNFKVLPDKTTKLYDFVNEKKRVAKILFEHGIMATNFSVEGDTLENYFISVIRGEQND